VAGESEADQLAQGVLRLARVARLPLVLDADLPEAHPAPETAQEALALGHPAHPVGHPPVEQTEVTRVERELDLRDEHERPVEERIGRSLEGAFLAPAPDRVGHLIA
jgi:hypothetical protein